MESTPPPGLTASRKRDRTSTDPVVVRSILDAGMVAHIGFIRDGWPVVLPFHYGVGDLGDGLGDQLIIHGSTGGRAFLDARGGDGVPVSVCVSFNDAIVLGRSQYDTGAHYRCVVAYGLARPVPPEARLRAFEILVDHVVPGRVAEVRGVTTKENVATGLLAIPLDHASAKIANTSTGEDPDDGEDRSVWAGVLPLRLTVGQPIPAPETLDPGELPPSVHALLARLNG